MRPRVCDGPCTLTLDERERLRRRGSLSRHVFGLIE